MNNASGRWKFWRRIPLRAQLFAGFLLPVILICASSLVVHRSLTTVMEKSASVERSIRSIALRNALLNAVLDAESGERGYVISGKTEFLQPYYHALDTFASLAVQIKTLTPQAEADIMHIEHLFTQWLNDVAKPIIAARQQSPDRLAVLGANALFHLRNFKALLITSTSATTTAGKQWQEFTEFSRLMKEAAALSMTTEHAAGWGELLALSEHILERQTETSDSASEVINIAQMIENRLNQLAHEALEAEDKAVQIVSSGAGKKLIDEIRTKIHLQVAQEEQQLQQLSTKNHNQMVSVGWLSFILPIFSLVLGMLLIFLMQAEILRSIAALRKGANSIAEGQLESRVDDSRSDELGALAHSFNQMAAELQATRWEAETLESLQSMLTSSQTVAEAYEAAVRVCTRLLPALNGAFYSISASRNLTEMVHHWGDASVMNTMFPPKECRALRTSRVHIAAQDSVEVFCQHTMPNAKATACIPLISGEESIGMLALCLSQQSVLTTITEQELHLALTIADRLSLALSNIRLTEKLHAQSVRDPLTGLFNRRYLEETMDRELSRSVRQSKPLSVVALDADHFKNFNDQFGHDAGDMVLKELAEQMRLVVRPSDLACRLGGEEFLLVLPDADTNAAVQRAEELRQRIAAVVLQYQGRSLGHITVSLGVATIPDHGRTTEELLQKADTALYQAKHNGRNKVEVASAAAAAGNLPSEN